MLLSEKPVYVGNGGTHPKRRILRGRHVWSVEQVLEELKAEMEQCSESTNSLSDVELTKHRSGLLQQRAMKREQQRLGGLALPEFNLALQRAPQLSLTVSSSMLEQSNATSSDNTVLSPEGPVNAPRYPHPTTLSDFVIHRLAAHTFNPINTRRSLASASQQRLDQARRRSLGTALSSLSSWKGCAIECAEQRESDREELSVGGVLEEPMEVDATNNTSTLLDAQHTAVSNDLVQPDVCLATLHTEHRLTQSRRWTNVKHTAQQTHNADIEQTPQQTCNPQTPQQTCNPQTPQQTCNPQAEQTCNPQTPQQTCNPQTPQQTCNPQAPERTLSQTHNPQTCNPQTPTANTTYTVCEEPSTVMSQEMAAQLLVELSAAQCCDKHTLSASCVDEDDVTVITRDTVQDKVTEVPALLKASFDQSSIPKNTTQTLSHTTSLRDQFLQELDATLGPVPVPKTSRTVLSFKTPKRSAVSKNACGVTSTPNTDQQCARFKAHQQQVKSPPRSSLSPWRMQRISHASRIISSPRNAAQHDPSSPFRVPAIPEPRTTRPSLALSQIATYTSPLNVSFKHTPDKGLIGYQRPSSTSHIPVPALTSVQDYLSSGGTPRPNPPRRSVTFASPLPLTPLPQTNLSGMLVRRVLASGPARRLPLPRNSHSRLPIPSTLQFDDDDDQPPPQPSWNTAKDTCELDSNAEDGYDMEALQSDTSQLSITDAHEQREGGQRRSIRTKLLDLSLATFDSPSLEKDGGARLRATRLSSSSDDSPVHIVARNNKQQPVAYLAKRKIMHPSSEQDEGLRRSTRNRVAPLRRWLGEVPVYRLDEQQNRELVGVSSVVVRDPFLVKHRTASMQLALERQQHARKLRQHCNKTRSSAKEQRKQQRVALLKENHRRCLQLDLSVDDIHTSSDSDH